MFNTIHIVLERAGIEPRRIAQAAVLAVTLATVAVVFTGFDNRGGFTLAVGFFAISLFALWLLDLWTRLRSRLAQNGAGKARGESGAGDPEP